MNKYTEDILCMTDTYTAISNVSNIIEGPKAGKFWKEAVNYAEFLEYYTQQNWKLTLACFLAAMSDKDLIEMEFIPGDSV